MTSPNYIEAVEKMIDQHNKLPICIKEQADRIEVLVRQRDGWEETALMYAQNVDFWKSKLAKAVEALRECQEALRDQKKQNPHMAKGYTVDAEKNARAVMAELEGETK